MRDRRDNRDNREQKNYDKRMIALRRVSKVHAGGKRLRFSAFVVAGDRKGSVGVALGRGMDTRSAIAKAEKKAAAHMKRIELIGDTIPHELKHKKGAAIILLRPARPGAGVIAGSAARLVLEMAGIENVYCKQLGSNDMIANAYCTFEALTLLRKGRVLRKMRNMRERVGLKEKIDEERRKREAKLAKTRKSNKRDNKSRNRRHVPRKNS
jgi:small subunit ribosomal protein S5